MMKAILPVRMKRMHFLMKDEGTISYPYKGSEIGPNLIACERIDAK